MSIMSYFGIAVKQSGTSFIVSGIRVKYLQRDLLEAFWTSRVGANIFTPISGRVFRFEGFFLPDVLFTLKKLLETDSYRVPKRTIQELINILEADTWIKPLTHKPKTNMKLLDSFTWKPLSHQAPFLENLYVNMEQYRLTGGMLNAAAGSGKTATSLFAAELLQVDTTIIISPLNAVDSVWDKTLGVIHKVGRTHWLSNRGEAIPGALKQYYVVHYAYLGKLLEQLVIFKNKRVMLIVDESHNFNDIKSQQTQNLIQIASLIKPVYTLLMSGTPFKALAIETVPLFRLIDPLFSEKAEEKFRAIYRGNNTRAVEILQHRLGLVSFKVEKSELKLKEPIFTHLNIKMANGKEYTLDAIKNRMSVYISERKAFYKARRPADLRLFNECLAYHENTVGDEGGKQAYAVYRSELTIVMDGGNVFTAAEQMARCNQYEKTKLIPSLTPELRKGFLFVKSAVKYPSLKIVGETLGNILGGARRDCYQDMVAELDIGEIIESTVKKTVIFSSYVEVCQVVVEKVSEDYMPLSVFGEATKQLSATVAKFEKDPNANPIVATYASLSTAVPLISADTIILIDIPFREYVLNQAISRVWRLGNSGNTYVYKLNLDTGEEPNIVSRSEDILNWAKLQVEDMTGVKSPLDITTLVVATEVFNETMVELEQTKPVAVSRQW